MHIDHDGSGEHSHPHEHTHEHIHTSSRNLDAACNQGEINGVSPKDIALLKYMLEHNKQHACELAETGGRLAGAGFTGTAELINDAVRHFDYANSKLETAIGLISEEG